MINNRLLAGIHRLNVRILFIIFIIAPFITEYIENGHFPEKPSDWITEITTTVIICITIIIINKQYRSLEKLSLADHLTGIGNRRQFDMDLRREILRSKRNGTRIILIFFDLDGFKKVNDVYGHASGDKVLVSFTRLLSRFIRKGSDFCYRFGGDEFAVLLTDLENDTSVSSEEIIEERLASLISGNLPYGVTASRGIVISRENEEYAEIIKRADVMMYTAKKNRLQPE